MIQLVRFTITAFEAFAETYLCFYVPRPKKKKKNRKKKKS